MYKTASFNLQRRASLGTALGHSIPLYLMDEYKARYQCSHDVQGFKQLVRDEVRACLVEDKNAAYVIPFGKLKDQLLFWVTDSSYLYFLAETQRLRNKKLVGQLLLRLKELGQFMPRYGTSDERRAGQ
jgi:hypothetical protein